MEKEWFTGSNFIKEGKSNEVSYAINTLGEVTEASALPLETSTQKAELKALTWALELGKGKSLNIYTNSQYAYGILHFIIWKGKCMLLTTSRLNMGQKS